jgi:hypothetical protein
VARGFVDAGVTLVVKSTLENFDQKGKKVSVKRSRDVSTSAKKKKAMHGMKVRQANVRERRKKIKSPMH